MSRWARRKGIDQFVRQWNDDTSHIRGMIDATPRVPWLVSRVTHLLAAALVAWVGIAAPAAAQVSDQPPTVSVYTVTPERIAATVAAVVALIGAVIGGLALARSAHRIGAGNGRARTIWALVLGLISVIIGGLHMAYSAGGFGTGNGLAGAIVALVLGLIGMVLGGLALARSRRNAAPVADRPMG